MHSSLVWYGKECYNSPKLGGIQEEADDYYDYEITILGGVSFCVVEKEDFQITKVESLFVAFTLRAASNVLHDEMNLLISSTIIKIHSFIQ